MTFADYFSDRADDYRRYRPHYPAALFAYLAAQTPAHERAWDCASGNGQAALGLTPYFERIIATDASESQLAQAPPHRRIDYRAAPAEQSGLATGSIDLLTVAQALHWFELERFYAEARRTLRPGGVIAAWCYGLANVAPAVDWVIQQFYDDLLEPYWPPQRRHIETAYRELPFPFDEWTPPAFAMTASWRLEQLLGYLSTWSALRAYRRRQERDPLPALRQALQLAWGDPAGPRPIHWPLHLRVGRAGPPPDLGSCP